MKYWWIKERQNPQLGTYYVACGKMPIKQARAAERGTLYGYNIMHKFRSFDLYQAKLDELRRDGEKVSLG
jgi:hypothetical protein